MLQAIARPYEGVMHAVRFPTTFYTITFPWPLLPQYSSILRQITYTTKIHLFNHPTLISFKLTHIDQEELYSFYSCGNTPTLVIIIIITIIIITKPLIQKSFPQVSTFQSHSIPQYSSSLLFHAFQQGLIFRADKEQEHTHSQIWLIHKITFNFTHSTWLIVFVQEVRNIL